MPLRFLTTRNTQFQQCLAKKIFFGIAQSKTDRFRSDTSYSASSAFSGIDSFTYKACDPSGICGNATILAYVKPKANVDHFTVVGEIDSPLPVLVNDYGRLNNKSITLIRAPSHGTAVPGIGVVGYTSGAYVGPDLFVYQVCDSSFATFCDTASVYLAVTPSQIPDSVLYPKLIFPSVFTPNGDGINDLFMIPGLDSYPQNSIQVFNRWGNVVYQSSAYGSSG